MTTPARPMSADDAITSRHSIRAFLNTPVAHQDIIGILSISSHAPSGTNTQPWKVYVLTGSHKQALSEAILKVYADPAQASQHHEEYAYYPKKWIPPYIDRRRKVGWDLYSLLGITREDKPRMHDQQARNYRFFDAPVGLVFTIDRVMDQGSWLDYGMFLQNIMITARARGLDTCPQAAFNDFHRVIESTLKLPENEMLVCCMSLGYADPDKIENTLRTTREPVDKFAVFLD